MNMGIPVPIEVQAINYRIEVARGGQGAPSQPVEIRLYVALTPPVDQLVLIHVESFMVPNQALTLATQPIVGAPRIAPSDVLVVEFFSPDGHPEGHFSLVGSNSLGQTAPTYFASPNCGFLSPTDLANLGFPNVHFILDVEFRPADQTFPGTGEDLDLASAVNAAPLSGGTPATDAKTVLVGDLVTVRQLSPSGAFDLTPFSLLGEVFSTGSPPASPFPGVAVSGNPATVVVVAGGPVPPFGSPALLPPGGFTFSFRWPAALGGAGLSVLLQGFVSSVATNNMIFAATNGQALQGL